MYKNIKCNEINHENENGNAIQTKGVRKDRTAEISDVRIQKVFMIKVFGVLLK